MKDTVDTFVVIWGGVGEYEEQTDQEQLHGGDELCQVVESNEAVTLSTTWMCSLRSEMR